LTVRLASTEDDARAMALCHAQLFPTGPWDKAFWLSAQSNAFDCPLILGQPTRAFALFRILGDEAELLTIGTTRPGDGDGALLLSEVVTRGLAAGAKRLFLEVSDANKAALYLYRQAGFVEIGRRPKYYPDGSDALTMRLNLMPNGDER